MKIATIEAVPIRPLMMREPFATTNVALASLHFVIVKVTTDAGIVGLGEALPAWEVTGETCDGVRGCVALYGDAERLPVDSVLTGAEIDTLEKIRRISLRMSPSDRPASVAGNPAAKAAIEQAMLDCCARLQGVSVSRLLDIPEHPVPAADVCGLWPVDETLRWVERTLLKDPLVMKLKIGGSGADNFDRDVEVINQARAMIRASGRRALLVADANEGFIDAERTVAFCKRIVGGLDWLEQPFLGDDPFAFKQVSLLSDTPLMADESLHTLSDAKLLHALGGVQHFNVKTMKAGGVIPALEIVDFAAEHGISCYVGSMVESSLGCLMGTLVANHAPASVTASDLSAFTHIADEPWQCLRMEGSAVVRAGTALHPERAAEILDALRLPAGDGS